MQIKDIFSDPCGDVFCYSVVLGVGRGGLEMLRWLLWPWHWWSIWGWWAVLCSESASELPARPGPSMGIIWALCGAQLQLSLNQDSITSLTLTLKGTRRFQTIFVQSALPCRLDFISERHIYKYLHRGPLSGRAQYLVSSYPHNIIALSSAQAQ